MKKCTLILMASTTIVLLALSACGQTGVLYLPDDQQTSNIAD